MSWRQRYIENRQWLDWYRREFKFRVGRSFDDPDDACSAAIETMLFEKLPALEPRHQANLDALVRTTYRNVLRDLVREHHGRPRAPVEMQRVGEPIAQIYFLHCIHRMPSQLISEQLRLPSTSVLEWVNWLKAKNKCPKRTPTVSLSGADPDAPMREMEIRGDEREDPVGEDVEQAQLSALVAILFGLSDESPASETTLGESLRQILPRLKAALVLSDEDRTLLRLRFIEDRSPSQIAEATGMKVHTVRRRHTALIERIGDTFRQHLPDL